RPGPGRRVRFAPGRPGQETRRAWKAHSSSGRTGLRTAHGSSPSSPLRSASFRASHYISSRAGLLYAPAEKEVEELLVAEQIVQLPEAEERNEGHEDDQGLPEDLPLSLTQQLLKALSERLVVDEPLDRVFEDGEDPDENRVDDRQAQHLDR